MSIFIPPQSASFKGNELVFLQGDHNSSSVVMSTGNPAEYEVEVSIRNGISSKFKTDVIGVAQHVVDSVVNGKRMVRNVFFPQGFDTAVGICRAVHMKNITNDPERYKDAERMAKEREADYKKENNEVKGSGMFRP